MSSEAHLIGVASTSGLQNRGGGGGPSSRGFMDQSDSPSMVQRAGDSLVVRTLVSGTSLNIPGFEEPSSPDPEHIVHDEELEDELLDDEGGDHLPQCKIKRNYTCPRCNFFTQNPRTYLYHLKDEHKEKIRVYECPKCVYASKHSQKLQRHIHMVHIVGKKNQKLAKKLPQLAPKLPPPPPLMKVTGQQQGEGSSGMGEAAGVEEEDSDDSVLMGLEAAGEPGSELEDMEDCEQEAAQEPGDESEEEDMVLDTSAHNSSAENDLETGMSTEEIKCSMCSFTSHSRTLVQRHENLAHLKKKFFRCTKCNYVTHMKARFTKHVKYHSMPMIKCDLCDFRTPYKWNLDRHYKNHQGDGEFKCPMCNFTADIKQSLTVHVQNHHLTPQQRLMRGMGRRNKVGASDAPAKELRMADVGLVGASGSQQTRSSPPRLTRADVEDLDHEPPMSDEEEEDQDRMEHEEDHYQVEGSPSSPVASTSGMSRATPRKAQGKSKGSPKKGKVPSFQEQNERHNFESDFIHPDDVLHKNGKVYYKNLKCSYCSYRAFWEGDILRHENRVHGVENTRNGKGAKKRLARPIPNLIPLQHQTTPPPSGAILRIPSVNSRRSSSSGGSQTAETPAMSEQDLNDMCAKSATSSLRDFASLIGEAFITDELQEAVDAVTASSAKTPPQVTEEPKPSTSTDNINTEKETPVKNGKESSPPRTPPQATTIKKKNSFFDKLREKVVGQEASNLVCEHCGHESKCLSEAVCHQKVHKEEESSPSQQRTSIVGMVGVSSTRCQHCRHRCKTSADLLVHLQSCLSRDSTSDGQDESQEPQEPPKEEEEEQEPPQCQNCEQRFDTEEDLSKHLDYCKPRLELCPEVSITEVRPPELHPMENKVFVWNQFSTEPTQDEIKPTLTIERIPAAPRAVTRSEDGSKSPEPMDEGEDEDGELSLVGFETAPGYGSVTNQKGRSILKSNAQHGSHVQKVFKCPKCNFWASAASRFHIHLVGHLNRKPFGCSQCDYRSNWRWDVAKHIRLKGVRDPLHAAQSRPRVIVNDDDSSRRNYSKYNKFVTLMTVRLGQTQSDCPPPTAGSSSSGGGTSLLPAPPRLIPAPTAPSLHTQGSRQQPLRPPPPLRAATHHVLSQLAGAEDGKHGIKRSAQQPMGSLQKEGGATKPLEPGTKRLLWRCKKCNYRGLNKEEVLAHVRTHYQTTNNTGSPILTPSVQVIVKKPSQEGAPALSCEKCPFVGRWTGELRAHEQHHIAQPGAIFKCFLCPFYVSTKAELLSHMRVHGVNEPEDYLSKAMEAKMAAAATKTKSDNEEDCGGEPSNKLFKSSTGGQFYHGHGSNEEAMEESDGPPFRCPVCSYHTAKRHLLHQHVRVHGIVVPMAGPSSAAGGLPPLDASRAKDVPLVWVVKNDKYLKMFKCRFCPHVNLRKVNIQEHEKMHKLRKGGANMSPSTTFDPSGMVHRCPQCTYQCNNAGVLSAHAKVHQESYPRSCALVDLQRSDDAQLQELGGEMAEPADLEDTDLEGGADSGNLVSGPAEMITVTPHIHLSPTSDMMAPPEDEEEEEEEEDTRLLYFCRQCPARFLFSRELAIHRRFHRVRLQHHCTFCNYTARELAHLQAHAKVHTQEYQERSQLLAQHHRTSMEHSKPVTVLQDGVWVVIEEAQPMSPHKGPSPPPPATLAPHKQYNCTRCPARFIKSVALSYHLTLHGGPGPYKCKQCDYSVKMYGNLVRHEVVHTKEFANNNTVLEPELKPVRAGMSINTPSDFVPLSGTDLFQHREAQKNGTANELAEQTLRRPQPPTQPLTVDPVFGTLMHGNPKFVYPTYFKNGKMKEKRYKCHKCPSAFEKREQYKVHLSLHGSKQKYRCDRCDYSVKYYANFIQHVRKHKLNDEATDARQAQTATDEASAEDDSSIHEFDEAVSPSPVSSASPRTAGKSIGQGRAMPTAQRQHLMLQQRRKDVEEEKLKEEQISIVPSYWCPHCPYFSMRRDGVETHAKRHVCNNPTIKTTFMCQHCDYSAPQSHFLREHNKLHFRWKPQPPGRRAETYMMCNQMELWTGFSLDKENDTDSDKRMYFQDKGNDVKEIMERFYPRPEADDMSDHEDGEEEEEVFVDLRTGEVVSGELERLKVEETESVSEPPEMEDPAVAGTSGTQGPSGASDPDRRSPPETPCPSSSDSEAESDDEAEDSA